MLNRCDHELVVTYGTVKHKFVKPIGKFFQILYTWNVNQSIMLTANYFHTLKLSWADVLNLKPVLNLYQFCAEFLKAIHLPL
jgi:hypothetical protein